MPYTPTPVCIEATTILVVEPPPIAKELVPKALGPGTSEVSVKTFVVAVAVQSAKALLLLI